MVTIDASPPTGLGAAAGDGLRGDGEEEEVERKKGGRERRREEGGGRKERWQRKGERKKY